MAQASSVRTRVAYFALEALRSVVGDMVLSALPLLSSATAGLDAGQKAKPLTLAQMLNNVEIVVPFDKTCASVSKRFAYEGKPLRAYLLKKTMQKYFFKGTKDVHIVWICPRTRTIYRIALRHHAHGHRDEGVSRGSYQQSLEDEGYQDFCRSAPFSIVASRSDALSLFGIPGDVYTDIINAGLWSHLFATTLLTSF